MASDYWGLGYWGLDYWGNGYWGVGGTATPTVAQAAKFITRRRPPIPINLLKLVQNWLEA